MSAYTISEIVVWLSLTAVLGVVLGWLLHSLVSGRRSSAVPTTSSASVEPGRFPLSARPLADGTAPSADYVVKGNERSMSFHTPDSPAYTRMAAETWFRTEDDAVAAGFRRPRNA